MTDLCVYRGVRLPLFRARVVTDALPLHAQLLQVVLALHHKVQDALNQNGKDRSKADHLYTRVHRAWTVLHEDLLPQLPLPHLPQPLAKAAEAAEAADKDTSLLALTVLVACELLQEGLWHPALLCVTHDPCPQSVRAAFRGLWPRASQRYVDLAWSALVAVGRARSEGLDETLAVVCLCAVLSPASDVCGVSVRMYGYTRHPVEEAVAAKEDEEEDWEALLDTLHV